MHALWFMIFALCVLAIAYRFYSAFIAARVLMLNDARLTPAHQLARPSGDTTKARCGPKFWKSESRRAASLFDACPGAWGPAWGAVCALAAAAAPQSAATIRVQMRCLTAEI